MKQISKIKNIIILIACMCSLMVGCLITMSLRSDAAEEGYRELTFADWGFVNGNARGTMWNTETPITSWDKVAVSGTFTFNASNTNMSVISFGANKASNSMAGLQIQYYGSAGMLWFGGNGIVTSPEAHAIWGITAGQEYEFELAFEKTPADKLKATLTVAGTSYTVEMADTLGTDICVYAHGSETFTYGPVYTPPVIEYTELTFADWGFVNGNATGTMWNTETPITSWDKVAVSGTFTFNASNTNMSVISFGANKANNSMAGLQIQYYGSAGMLWFGGNGINTTPAAHGIFGITAGQEYGFELTFEKTSADKLKATLTVAGTSYTVEMEDTLGTDICVYAHGSETFAYGPVYTPPAIEYTELTFANWGFTNEKVTGTIWSKKTPITSWDEVAVNGSFTFNSTNTNMSVISFGADKVNNSMAGLQIQYYGSAGMLWFGGNGINTTPAAHGIFGVTPAEACDFRLTFEELSSGNLKATLTIKEQEYVVEILDDIDKDVCLNAYGSESFMISPIDTTAEPEPEPSLEPTRGISEYKMLSFKDFGIGTGTLKAETWNCRGEVADLNGKVFKGILTFQNKADELDGIINIGGTLDNRWYGLRVGMSNAGGLYICEAIFGQQRWDISPEKMNIQEGIEGKAVEIALTFDCIDANNVSVGVYVNDVFCGEKLYKDLTIPFGSTLMVYTVSTITIENSDTPWIKFLKSDVDLTYFGFSNENWKVELKNKSK